MFQNTIKAITVTLMAFPVLVFAQEDLGEVSSLFSRILSFVNDLLVPLVFAVALVVFLYGIFKYFILGGGDETKRSEGRQLMLYSIIGFVVMISIFGIVGIISDGLGFTGSEEGSSLDLPSIPGQ